MPSSLTMLLPPASGFSPRPPVSVSGTGARRTIAAFPGGAYARFATFFRSASGGLPHACGFSCTRASPVAPVFPFPAHAPAPRPRSSACARCRTLHLPSIGYASRPPLRSRLSRGRSALPRNPWTFGPEDSRLRLATHSGILPSRASTVPSGTASAAAGMLPYHAPLRGHPRLRRRVSAPDIFGAGTLGQWAVTHSLNAWLLLGQRPGCL